jgi:hypothetical protein
MIDDIITRRLTELEEESERIKKPGDERNSYYVGIGDFRKWTTSVLNLLQRAFGEDSVHFQSFNKQAQDIQGYTREFEVLLGIFQAAKEDYEKGYLFHIRLLIKAEVLGDALDQATELLASGHKDAAAIASRVALEIALKGLCVREGVPPQQSLHLMNVELARKGMYNQLKRDQITGWARLGNRAAHGEWNEYNTGDVDNLIQEVRRFVTDYLS